MFIWSTWHAGLLKCYFNIWKNPENGMSILCVCVCVFIVPKANSNIAKKN